LHSTSETPSITNCAKKLVAVFDEERIDYMFIGGLALTAYGQIRATQDIDVAIIVKKLKNLKRLITSLVNEGFEAASTPNLKAACIYLLDRENLVDVELWQKPDGIRFDRDLLSRRKKANLPGNTRIWIIGPEDFIVNKLAKSDRGAQDESDAVSVLIGMKDKLDREYLDKRAEQFVVNGLLKTLETRIASIA